MPSKNMIKKGKRRQTVKHEYRLHRDAVRDAAAAQQQAAEATSGRDGAVVESEVKASVGAVETPVPLLLENFEQEDGVRSWVADAAVRGKRLDAYLARALPEVSRARVQLLIEGGQVRVGGRVEKASLRLEGGERIEIEGEPRPAPLRAEPEDIPLRMVYEDADLAVVDKPAGMTVHAGAGDAEHNRGTLVNALLFHFGRELSAEGGALRPGIVHRLDKETSGLILVAKNDATHRKLAAMFAERALRKVYVALVHGEVQGDEGTVNLPIGRDPVRRVRMTAKRGLEHGARPAVSHWRVLERFEAGTLGPFTLLEVRIETGRTHQIRVHLAALGYPVVGDTLYGAPGRLPAVSGGEPEPTLARNFLHAAELDFVHPQTGESLQLQAALPAELEGFLERIRPVGAPVTAKGRGRPPVARMKAK